MQCEVAGETRSAAAKPSSENSGDHVLRTRQHPAYELSEGPAVNQPHISLFQRRKSSVSLPKDEGFTFGVRQDRQINVRIGRQQHIRPNSPTGKSSQRTLSAEKANETPDVVAPKEKHRYVAELNIFEPKLKACALALYLLPLLTLPKSSPRLCHYDSDGLDARVTVSSFANHQAYEYDRERTVPTRENMPGAVGKHQAWTAE